VSTEHWNPLHSKSLTPKELVPRRRIVWFNIHEGVKGIFIVSSFPTDSARGLQVTLENQNTSEKSTHSLADLGVAPYTDSVWNEQNFVVDISNAHELPTTLLPRPADPYLEFDG
jgi:hypothetical protein